MDLNDIFCLCTMHFIKSTEQRGILSFVLFSLTVDKRGIQHLVYIEEPDPTSEKRREVFKIFSASLLPTTLVLYFFIFVFLQLPV